MQICSTINTSIAYRSRYHNIASSKKDPEHPAPPQARIGRLLGLLGLGLLLLAVLAVEDASAQVSTVLRLDPIPSPLRIGDTVTFSGTLLTTDGRFVRGATIEIKDDDSFGPDDFIVSTITDNNGRFSVPTTVINWDQGSSSVEIYAVFEGSGTIARDRSETQNVRITDAPVRTSTVLHLDTIPSPLRIGDTVTFSGTLMTTDGRSVRSATIDIKDDDPGSDDLIKSTRTDNSGRFAVSWTVRNVDIDSVADIYAVFEGSNEVERSRSATQNVRILGPSNAQLTISSNVQSVYAGNTVTFSGWLTTSDGTGIADKTIEIKEDDPFLTDEMLSSGRTDSRGYYSIDWVASAGLVETDFDVYAVFEGDRYFKRARSANLELPVLKYSSSITLDPIPARVKVDDIVVFSGALTIEAHNPAGAIVHIKDDDPGPDDLLDTAIVDQHGRFSVSWTAQEVDVDSVADIYAVYEGNQYIERTTTANQELSISKYSGSLTLDPIPSSAGIGDIVVFSGALTLEAHSPANAIVYIKDEDSFGRDDLLATAFVDPQGKFAVNWIVRNVDKDSVADIYAVFEGSDKFSRQTTCGSGCGMTQKLRITEPAPPEPTPSPRPQEYMNLYYALDLVDSPKVAIVPSPDSYNNVSGHIIPVQEGVMMWTGMLEARYGGDWDVDFAVITPGMSHAGTMHDIVINIITGDDDSRCIDESFGWAYIQRNAISPIRLPIQTSVCSEYDMVRRDNAGVMATAAHEFIHAMGLGHTFNGINDLMCSSEDGMPTCPDRRQRSKTPSALNLGAVVELYGLDGFKVPNNSHTGRFALGGTLQEPGPSKPITVSADRSLYRSGETIMVTGQVRDRIPTQDVTLTVFSPINNIVVVRQLSVAEDGTFETELETDAGLWRYSGIYTIRTSYGSIDAARVTIEYAADEATIQTSITRGQVTGITADAGFNSLTVTINSTGDGILNIELPEHVIVSRDNGTRGDDTDFFVLVDFEEIANFASTSSGETRTLTIPFAAGSESIEIIGSWVVQNKTLYSNSPPAGQDITITVAPGRTADRDIAGIISDPEGNNITVAVSRQPSQGNASASGTTVSYTARPGAAGTDSFGYILVDEFGASSVWNATVMISDMAGADQDPAALDILINAELHFPSAVTPAVMDPAGGNVTITRVTGNTLGSLDTSMLPQISYTPNQTGIDMLTYMVSDDRGGTANATISIFINPEGNARPVLDHIYNVGGRVGVDLNFTAIAVDDENDPLTFGLANAPDGASITAGGDFSWRPTSSQDGTHTVTFIVHDDSGGANWQHVAVTILRADETNLPPIPQDIDAGVVLGGGRGFQPDIDDPENDGTEIVRVYDSSLGDVDRSFLSQGIIVYVAGVLGDDEVVYTVSDGRGGFTNGTLSITVEEPANVRPLIEFVGDKSVNAGDELTFTVDADDLDGLVVDFGLEGDTQGPSMSPQGIFSWTPTANDVGRHEFTILVFDDAGENSTVSITVTVRPEGYRNSPPVAPDVVIMTPQDVLSIVRPTLTDPDEGDPVRISGTGDTTKGSILSGFLRAGIIIYLPNQGESGTETITYTVSDSSDETDTATINVFISARGNTDPILGSIYFRNINAGNPLTFDLEGEDPDGDAISYRLVGAPDGIEISPEGRLSWTPTAADVGNHTFTIVAYDDRGGADSKTAVIRVLPAGTTNQDPNAPDSTVTVAPGGSVVITPAISDPDGDRVAITDAVASGTGVVIQSEDSINYIHVATTPTETVTYTVTDARGATATGTITITIR